MEIILPTTYTIIVTQNIEEKIYKSSSTIHLNPTTGDKVGRDY